MSESKPYPIAVVLTVTTGRLICEIDRLYDIMSHLLGQSIFTHQIPTYTDICRAEVFIQYPQLKGVDVSGLTRDNWKEFVARQAAVFGETLEIKPIRDVPRFDPLEDILGWAPAKRITVVDVDDGEPKK